MKLISYVLSAVLLLLATGVFYARQPQNQAVAMPAVVRVGVLPDENTELLRDRFEPLLSYLAGETGLEFVLIESSGYDELVGLFVSDRIDLAYFGGYTFVQAHALHDAMPLVMREIDTRFTSYFLTSHAGPGQQIVDYQNKVFSFGDRLSTSGHLMPRHYLQRDHELAPEAFFAEIRYSGAHDKTAYLVRDGAVDLGVANSAIIRAMLKDGRLRENDLRIIWETPPFPDYVWAAQPGLPVELQNRLRSAFLGLDAGNASDREILDLLGAKLFLPAAMSDFSPLMEVARSMQLLARGGS